MDDRSDGVEKGERVLARLAADRRRERRGGERAGSDDGEIPLGRRQAGDLAAFHRDQRMGPDKLGDGRGEPVAVNRQRSPGGHLVSVSASHDQRPGQPHLRMENSDCVRLGIVGAKGVGADQFGETVRLVRIGPPDRPHLVEYDRNAGLGDLPCGLRAGKAAAYDVYRAQMAPA